MLGLLLGDSRFAQRIYAHLDEKSTDAVVLGAFRTAVLPESSRFRSLRSFTTPTISGCAHFVSPCLPFLTTCLPPHAPHPPPPPSRVTMKFNGPFCHAAFRISLDHSGSLSLQTLDESTGLFREVSNSRYASEAVLLDRLPSTIPLGIPSVSITWNIAVSATKNRELEF